jgi:hypothetical protein
MEVAVARWLGGVFVFASEEDGGVGAGGEVAEEGVGAGVMGSSGGEIATELGGGVAGSGDHRQSERQMQGFFTAFIMTANSCEATFLNLGVLDSE